MMKDSAVSGGPGALLRAEGLVVLLVSLFSYSQYGAGWGIFVVCCLIPDLSLFGYAAGPRVGAALYNAAHSYVGALLCLMAGMYGSADWAICAGLIWIAHIGFDRALGYGLKYGNGFRFTHLGVIGKPKS